LSGLEAAGHFLEGAGSLVLDRVHKVAYTMASDRTRPEAATEWSKRTGYEVVLLEGLLGSDDIPISHTDMILAIGTSFVVICAEAITSEPQRAEILARLEKTGRTIVHITFNQVKHFCGNVIELHGMRGSKRESTLFMSTKAHGSFTEDQLAALAKCVDRLVHVDISLIENVGGGGVRSCLAELF
jgi:hypothetical protein